MKYLYLYGLLAFLCGMLSFAPSISAQTKKIRKDTLQARQLLTAAKDLLAQGQLEGMQAKLNQASKLVESAIGKENALYADILHQFGRFHFANDDVHAGIAATEQSLDIRLKVWGVDHLDVALSYQNLSAAYGGWHLDYEKAMNYRQKAWEIRLKKLGKDDPLVIKSWKDWRYAQGVYYWDIGGKEQVAKNWDIALGYLQKADSALLLSENNHTVFLVRANIAEVYHQAGKFQKCATACEAAFQYLEPSGLKDSLGEAMVLNTYGNCLFELNRLDESEKAYSRALAIKAQKFGSNSPEIGSALSNLATIYLRRGQFKKAIEMASEGIALREKGGMPAEEILNAHIHLAFFYNTAGLHQQALALYQKAEQILTQNPTKHENIAGSIYDGVGGAYLELGDLDKAREYKELAILSFTKTFGSNYHFIARIHFNLGLLAIDEENWPAVVDHARSALKIIQLNPNDVNPTFLIDVYEQLSDGFSRINLDSSLHYAQYALHLCETKAPDDDFTYINSLSHLGLIYNQARRFAEADSLLKMGEAKFLERFGEKHSLVAFLATSRAQTLAQMGNYPAALERYEAALQTYGYSTGIPWEKLVNPNPVLATLQEKNQILIKLYQQKKDPALSKTIEENFSEILNALNYLRRNYQGKETKLLFAKQFRHAAEDALNWYHNISSAQALEKAWVFAEKSRSLAVLEAFLNTKAWQVKGAVDSTRLTEELFAAATNKWSKAYEAAATIAEKDSCYRRLLTIKLEHEAWLKNIEEQDSNFYKLKYADQTLPVKQTQAFLKDQQSLIEYFVGEKDIYIFLVQPQRYEMFKIPKDTAFEHWIEDFTRNGIYGYYAVQKSAQSSILKNKTLSNYSTAAFKLYQTLVLPLQSKLGTKLIIVPDGILSYVPFEALLTQKPLRPDAISAYRYLLHKHQISYANSLTLLKEMSQKKHRQEPSQKLLAMAPFSAKYLADVSSNTAASQQNSKRDSLSILVWSDLEVSRIAERFKEKALYGKEASLTQFLQQAPNARIIHLSTHGNADDRLGDFVNLIFGMSDAKGDFEKLYARDLYSLSLNADLVVLSACETGLGKLQNGEGIISLSRAFIYSGAKSIVTTLWKVYEEPSQQLCDSFYQYLQVGKPKDEALHLAKKDYLTKNSGTTERLHPFFWAGFIGIGDMSPVKF